MRTKNVTYILGAGASCYSQPLIYNMKERMEALLYFLNPDSNKNISKFGEKTEQLYKKYFPIVSEANKHFTPDTYAKKLSLTKRIDDLDILKEFLNLYFLFEQDYLKNAYTTYPINEHKEIKKQLIELAKTIPGLSNEDDGSIGKSIKKSGKMSKIPLIWDDIKTPIDYRYDVFFATLLENKEDKVNPILLLPANYNIISWNYDNQFELAYKEYSNDLNLNNIRERLGINSKYQSEKSHIVKLNGDCNCWDEENEQELTLLTTIERLLENKKIKNTIKFAWEGSCPQYDVINEIMFNTETLVIIGYSFPNFNRVVDKKIFSGIENRDLKKIVIQVPDSEEFEKIKQRILIINDRLDESLFHPIYDKDQFYIPI